MRTNQDFRDLFAALNAAEVDYLVVGGHAPAAHGHVRATKDIDVWVRCNAVTAARTHSALQAFGAPVGDLTFEISPRRGSCFKSAFRQSLRRLHFISGTIE